MSTRMKYQLWLLFICLLLSDFTASQTRPSLFRLRQKYPNQDESEVCSRIRDVIPRDSGRYRRILIRNPNNQALYANDDSRRMTSRAKSKLDILASRVQTEWSGVRVRVLRAWTDQVDNSDPTSLHYEGRSVRLQLSDRDRGKLGRLAGLAVEAGFDWVEYTNPDYIRASVIPDVCQTSVDLAFLLDESGSVGEENFEKVKEFVKKVVDFFNVGETGTHIAVTTYHTYPRERFDFTEHYTKSELKNAVNNIVYNGFLTYTGEALDFVREYIFTRRGGMRDDPGIPKVLVLITDGLSNGKSVLEPANKLRNLGVSIFSIGVGNSVSEQELNEIATDPDEEYVFVLNTFNDLSSWVDRLSSVSCSEGSLIKSCDSSVSTVTSGSFKYFRTEFNVVTNNEVSVEVRDLEGTSHLYASSTSRNPGPLDPGSVKNEDELSPRAVTVRLEGTKTVFIAVQGQKDTNKFSISFWDNLFSQSSFRATLREGLSVRFLINLTLSSDDYRLTYQIADGNQDKNFELRTTNNVAQIWTTQVLDHETISQYKLVVVAEDTASPCHKSRTLVVVDVQDENDNSPRFTENPYRADIKENAQSGTVVKTVRATDKDSGLNAQITYSITSGNPGNLFRINSGGQVILQGLLDYETTRSYRLQIRAQDGGNPSKSGFTYLQITVIDVNESPSISCVGSCSFTVSEAVVSGTKVGGLKASDPDTQSNCALRYDIPSNAQNTFQVNANGDIQTRKGLDREIVAQYDFFVRVRDCASPPLSASVRVTVVIEDVNDNSPTFTGPYRVSISENKASGSDVVQVTANDADEGDNGKVIYSLGGADSSTFQIDRVSGRITTRDTLDYETKKSYSFNVTATDRGINPNTGTTTVTVNVIDVNDQRPVFIGSPYSAQVLENSTFGTRVKTIKATDSDSGSGGEVRYFIHSGNIGSAFAIDERSGSITVRSRLDRETRSSYNLGVRASDRGSPSLNSETTVAITIQDVNDNSPVFQGLPYSKSVSENTAVEQLVLKVAATDRDSGSFGEVTYSIKSPSVAQETFKIDSNGNIRLKQKLDYETKKTYTFTITATDGGGSATDARVDVIVEDYNDNIPVFDRNPYIASVEENVNVGHVVGAVRATDRDSGPRGRVMYTITNIASVGNAFAIGSTGTVTVASSLDRETRESYSLNITARDDGSPQLSSTTIMTITVGDANDNKPVFPKSRYSLSIRENNSPNAVVGIVGPATDKDKGLNAEIVYSIVSGNSGRKFDLETTGELIAKEVLDREQISSYNLVIQARDKGSPALYARVPVNVIVLDENDNSPVFSKQSYKCQIYENSAPNSPVCFVLASDKDVGRNGTVTYELVAPSASFSVDQNNGEIKAKVSLDREAKDTYTFQVRAKDGGSPQRRSVVTVTVAVIDKNDNEPRFNQSAYMFDVSEDAVITTSTGRVLAEDNDKGENGQVLYSIIGGNINAAFDIDQNTGDILVKSSLDRETLANYELTVQAKDRGSPALSSSRFVFVNVKDVNDNDPIFTKSLYNGLVAEDASVGSGVAQVEANDADEGVNAKITYSITGGQNKDHFSIEKDTGFITTASTLDYETINAYTLDVTATDGGSPSRSGTSRVNITVKNTNDNAPTFVAGSSQISVSEAVAIGTNVVQFNATDIDGSRLTFSIFSGNTDNSFKLHSQKGILTTDKRLDRETIPRYNLSVTVADNGNQSSSQNLSVIVLDVNDNSPKFEPSSYRVNVTENHAAGPIVTVKATDKDEGDNGRISFSIDQTSSTKFLIDSASGVISTKISLDHEVDTRYVIQVTARDAGTPSLSSVATVEVTVIDRNDNSPDFKTDYRTSLLENTAKGRTILRVEATDPDSGMNGNIEYNITSGNSLGFFSVNSTDGNLKVEKSPDRETNPSFTLTISASNKVPLVDSPPTTKTTCTVVITIDDVNDNAPEILNNVSTVSIRENTQSPTLVFDVDAVDKDAGVNSQIEYKIVPGNVQDAFAIDLDTGRVTVNGLLDREILASYKLKIRASDKGTPSLFSEKEFTVELTDEDDNAPVFNPASYDASISENAHVSTFVVQITATDRDIGVNGKITYSVISGNDQGHFRVDSVSGNVTTNALLDYEKVKNYTLVVTARDTKHTVQTSVRIRVININDNNPVFDPARYSVNIPENYSLDQQFLTLKATDKDPFGGLTYIILSGNSDRFSVDPNNGALSVTAKLDRETTDFYNLTVRVTDGGVPSLSDVGFVEIQITDSNDNAPKFNSSFIQRRVKENTPIDTAVLTVSATDRDLGLNAKLRYSISKGNELRKFNLDQDSGVLFVNDNIDREKTSNFRLEIVAEDLGSPSLRSETLVVEIEVLDENDNDPEFKKKSYYRNITENLSGGTFVEDVEATDKDIGLNGKVVYSIKRGARGHFTVGNETGIVETTVPLDRENVSSYELIIEAKDLGIPSRNSTAVLYINVVDANDNAPGFILSSLHGNVTEEKPRGQFVTRIVATDKDEGLGSQIEYKLTTNMLEIDPETGDIKTLVPFDYEKQQNHTFKVTASDKGNPSLSTTADLIITVIDIDDNCPDFDPKEYNVTIQENLPFNYTIVRVTATDKDSAENKGLDYGIRRGNEAGSFTIDSVTGVISPNSFVDREFSPVYNLIVRAGSDFCGVNATNGEIDETTVERLSASIAHVNIFVTDVNDNAPRFHEPSYTYAFSDIHETSLLWLNATDPDVGVNAEVDFGLANVQRDRFVRTLTVTATDRGVPPQSSNTTLVVTMAGGVNCEAMLFDVSRKGNVTVKTLCNFSPFKQIEDALVGRRIELGCEAQGNTIPEYRWTRNSILVKDWSPNGTYVIRSLSKDDAGQYACSATSEAGTILSDPIELVVKEPPTITVHPKNTSAELGKRAVLSCLAKGDQPIEYSWYRNGELLPSSGGLIANKKDLIFEEVIPQDAAEYYCEATNRVRNEPARSRKARLQVFSADAVVEMDISVDKPRYRESCQYFDIRDLMNTLQGVMNGTVFVTEYVKPNATCNITSCSSDPCQNQGTCQTTESGFICQCPRGWNGRYCEIDVDECKTDPCGNGTCQNRNGSYSCSCSTGSSGKRCQISDVACRPNPCQSNETCYPKATINGYECIGDVQTVTMVFKLDPSRRPWKNWMKYDVQMEIKNAIANRRNTVSRQGAQGKRRRREAVDYGECSVVIQNSTPRESEVELEIVLVCVNPPSKDYVCAAMFNEGKVTSCTGENGIVTETPPTRPPAMEPVRLTVVFAARHSDGREMEGTFAINILQGSDVDSRLEKYGITPLAYRARSVRTAGRGDSARLSAGAVAGITLSVIVILVVAIAILFVIIRTRSRRGKEFNIKGRAVLARTQSNDTILKREILMEEFGNLETRGMRNKTLSEIYEESQNVTNDLEDGTFMVENPQLSLKNANHEYMNELQSSPWYHGSITRSKAEDILNEGGNEGSFIVRAGLDEGEFYISVIAPEGGPRIRHMAVNRRASSFVAVCGPFADAMAFTTFHELVEYLQSTPTHYDGIASDLLLKDYVEKK